MPDRELPPLPEALTDRDQIGMSTVLGLSVPMLTLLLQCVAEAEGPMSLLQLTAPNGARVSAVHFRDQDWFTLFTDDGKEPSGPYQDERHQLLLDHGDRWNDGYEQRFVFDTDVAFEVAARIMVGTLQHPYRTEWKALLAVVMDLRP